VGSLEDAGGLLADLVQRSLHDGLARLAPLELAHQLEHLLDEGVHGVAVVAAHGHRELAVCEALGGAPREARDLELGRVGVGHV
jgi:hypothetical protein